MFEVGNMEKIDNHLNSYLSAIMLYIVEFFIHVGYCSPFLFRGAEPKQLAFSAAIGITLGIFPICGMLLFNIF